MSSLREGRVVRTTRFEYAKGQVNEFPHGGPDDQQGRLAGRFEPVGERLQTRVEADRRNRGKVKTLAHATRSDFAHDATALVEAGVVGPRYRAGESGGLAGGGKGFVKELG